MNCCGAGAEAEDARILVGRGGIVIVCLPAIIEPGRPFKPSNAERGKIPPARVSQIFSFRLSNLLLQGLLSPVSRHSIFWCAIS
jgi:hypothetical protein